MKESCFPLFGSEHKTNWYLLVLIALIPLRNLQIQYIPNFGGGLNVINVLFLLSLMHAFSNGNKNIERIAINKLILIYIVFSVFSLIIGYDFLGESASGNWNHLKDQLLPVLLVIIIQKSATDMIQWRRIMLASLLSIIYCFRLVWIQYNSVSSWHYSDNLRISGPFMDLGANEMGAYAVTVGLISLACLITCWDYKRWRNIFLVLAIASFGSILYSYSRGAYLATIIGMLFIFFKYRKTMKLLLPTVIIGAITLSNLPVSIEERFSSISAGEEERDDSAQSRFVFWEIAFERFKDKPIIGYGYSTVRDPRINPYEMDTHNYFVKVLVEQGIVGISILILLFLSFWKMAKNNVNWSREDPIINGVVLGMHGVIVALVIGNMFGDRFSHYPIITIFWSFIGLLSILNYLENKSDEYKN